MLWRKHNFSSVIIHQGMKEDTLGIKRIVNASRIKKTDIFIEMLTASKSRFKIKYVFGDTLTLH